MEKKHKINMYALFWSHCFPFAEKMYIFIFAKENNGSKSNFIAKDRRSLRRTLLKNHKKTAAKMNPEIIIQLNGPISTRIHSPQGRVHF